MSSGIEDFLGWIEDSLLHELEWQYPDVHKPARTNLPVMLEVVYAATHIPFVFVIDEWDAVFRVHKDDPRAQARYLDWLRYVLKDKAYVALGYMTGFLPIKKYGQHSALNMFQKRSMVDASPIERYTGFPRTRSHGSAIPSMRLLTRCAHGTTATRSSASPSTRIDSKTT